MKYKVSRLSIILCAGTRPNFMKIAPLYHEGIKRGHNMKILHTGQHYDTNLSDIFFKELDLPTPDINLNVSGGNREQQVEEVSKKSAEYFFKNTCDLVVVVGDVNATLGCSWGAKKNMKKIAHVESGLRSFDMGMPEEVNRIETDKIADYKFCSEPDGIVNLKNEQMYSKDNTFLIGNIMIDSLISNLNKIENVVLPNNISEEIGTEEYVVVTFHRPSNVDNRERLTKIFELLNHLAKNIKIIFPMHPRTKGCVENFSLNGMLSNMVITEPLGYIEFMKLVKNSKFVLTDSGGIQEETSYFGIPCITMRSNTERPITLSEGTSYLAGEDIDLAQYLADYLVRKQYFNAPSNIDLWDGKTAQRIFDVLEEKLY